MEADSSRIAVEMREHLGHVQWRAFVAHANAHYKDKFIAAFTPASGVLRCEGSVDGGECPHSFSIDLASSPSAVDNLDALHVDHLHDLSSVCDVWRRLVPERPARWHEGIDAAVLCQALLGMEPSGGMPRCLHFLCGNKMRRPETEMLREERRRRPSRRGRGRWCHRHGAHHARVLRESDLLLGDEGMSASVEDPESERQTASQLSSQL